jgi:hypothetical protein
MANAFVRIVTELNKISSWEDRQFVIDFVKRYGKYT